MRTLVLLIALAGCRSEKETVTDTGGTGTVDDVDLDGDGYLVADGDCDDSDPQVHPGADEICDSIDNNCDGSVDEGVTTTFYADEDTDGFGDPGDTAESCEAPAGYVSVPNDCDDSDADSFPGASERCDGKDNDCDGDVDEDVLSEWYADADEDGYGDPGSLYAACDPPPGYIARAEDCDDTSASAYPGAAEVCDEADNDCDGAVDEDVTTTYYQDADGDGYGVSGKTTEGCALPTGFSEAAGDCDDLDVAIHPDAEEVCDDIDNDCDGTTDEDDATDAATWYADADSDGYGDAGVSTAACDQPSGYVSGATDCDDTDGAVSPAASEVCNAVDDDCDGTTDEDDATDASTWYADNDADGYGGSSSTVACDRPSGFADNSDDCDDSESAANPGEAEVCDEIDNDCDGDTDEGVTSSYYADADGDGYGDAARATDACSLPSGYAADDTDCDDLDASSYPGAAEVCDAADNDCDGTTDEGVTTTYYADDDGDGHGDPGDSTEACALPSGYVSRATDCDDSDAQVSPDGVEFCDGVDNDCDGSTDEDDAADASVWYADADGDGFGDEGDVTDRCDQPSGYVSDATDCDDSDAAINPDAEEVCDGADNDCDGDADSDATDRQEWYADADGDGYGVDDDVVEACEQPSGYAEVGGDCDDGDSGLFPEGGECPEGADCYDILLSGLDDGDGTYTIDPDGSGSGEDPFDVTCDMSTDGGGWTLVLHLYDMGGFDEDDFIADYGHNLFTDETWSYDGASLSDGLSADGLTLLSGQGAIGVGVMDGLWDDLRMTCSRSDDDDTESYYAQVDGYATTNGSWDLLGAASNGTAYAVDSSTNSSGLSTIYHDNETNTVNSGHYLCDYTNSGPNGTSQFGFCYTNHLYNPNTYDYGDSIVSLAFGTTYGSDGWSDGFTMECGNMGTTALQNAGTVSIWVR